MRRFIDLRSDTVTTPTRKMRAAMARAIVGDDVLGEDPTVRELEERSAELLGKEDALFLVSGTMANQVAVMTFCRSGDEIVVPEPSHMHNLKVGALSALVGVQARPLRAHNGVLDLKELSAASENEGVPRVVEM